jgi:hypothetical protein
MEKWFPESRTKKQFKRDEISYEFTIVFDIDYKTLLLQPQRTGQICLRETSVC